MTVRVVLRGLEYSYPFSRFYVLKGGRFCFGWSLGGGNEVKSLRIFEDW